MRRIIIFFYWLFKEKHNVTFFELLRFSLKPPVRTIARRYLKEMTHSDSFHEVTFKTTAPTLYWPKECPIDGIYQVTSETFDNEDWHYYQKKHTEVIAGEVLLDIGAAEGLFSLTVANLCKSILLVEPNDYFVKALNRTFAPYKEKVSIFNVAVGSQNGEIVFNPDSLIGRITPGNTLGTKKPLRKIDDVVTDIPITYLKADLEGFETEMLRGAEKTIKSNRPKIAITAYHKENNTNEIISLIKTFVPEYQHYTKGISQTEGKPVMIHFWIPA
jgi:FkbM family methyltransferase